MVKLGPANVHDSKLLMTTIENKIFSQQVKCLCDSGYVGKQLRNDCLKKNLRLIVKPRKKRNGLPTHILLKTDREMLDKQRNLIELLNGQVRRYRGLNIKYVKRIDTYKCLLHVALLSITCYNLFVART